MKHLSSSTGNLLDILASQASDQGNATLDSIDKKAIVVHAGQFQSQDGPVDFDSKRVKAFVERNNVFFDLLARQYGGKDKMPLGAYPPVFKDHEDGTDETIGRVLGPFSYQEIDIPGVGQKVPAALCDCVRFIGEENVKRVMDGRIYHLSVGIDDDNQDKLDELSVTPFPAANGAMLLSKGKKKVTAEKIDETTGAGVELAKGKKATQSNNQKLSKGGKMSKHLKRLSESAKSLKKLSTDLTAIRTTLVKETAGMKLAARRGKVMTELKGLVRMGKMTPAEFKTAKVDDIAALDDKGMNLVLSSYTNRQPVIMAGQRGSANSIEAGAMAQEIGIKRLKSEAKKELTRLGARFSDAADDKADKKHGDALKKMGEDAEKKLAAESKDDEKELSEGAEHDEGAAKEHAEHMAGLEKHMKHMAEAMEMGDQEKAKEHMGHALKCMEAIGEQKEKLGVARMSMGDPAAAEASQAKLEALESQVAELSSVVERVSAELDKVVSAEQAEGHEDLEGEGADKEGEKKLEDGEEEKKELSDADKEDKKDLAEGEKAEGDKGGKDDKAEK